MAIYIVGNPEAPPSPSGAYYAGPDLGYLTPTIYAAVTAQGTGSGNSEANAMALTTALAIAGPGAIVGVLPGVYSKAAFSDKFRPAWQLTNNGTASQPIIVVAKYSAIDLAGKTPGARWTTADLGTVFAHPNRSELRHTGVTPGTGGPAFGSSFLPAVQSYQWWIGFCADEAQAQPMQDSGPAVIWACVSCKILRAVLYGRDRSSTWGGDNHCGVRVEDWSGGAEVSDCVIYGFRTANGGSAGHNHAGILRYSHGNQTGLRLYHNYVFGCFDGIFLKDEPLPDGNAQDEIVRYNILADNDAGLEIATQNMGSATAQSFFEFNLITGGNTAITGQQGNAFRCHIRYNTLYCGAQGPSSGAGLDANNLGGGSNSTFIGNIVYGTAGTLMYEAGYRASAIPAAPNYNCYYSPTGFSCRHNGSTYNSLAAWRAHSANPDQNSINTNPLFTNPAAYNFEPQPGSPVLTAAQDGGRIGHTRGGVIPGPRYRP